MANHSGEILGKTEDFNKSQFFSTDDTQVKSNEYGGLHVEPYYGRILEILTPPSEPGVTTWTVPAGFDPRWIYSDVLPAPRTDARNTSSRIKVTYNVSGESGGDQDREILIVAGHPRPCYGCSKIQLISGRISIYGHYTKPVVNDEG